jgi:hypothetical protein
MAAYKIIDEFEKKDKEENSMNKKYHNTYVGRFRFGPKNIDKSCLE